MHANYTAPSTLDGIRRLAGKLKREHDLRHTQALDRAAQISGFENYQHARHQLAARPVLKAPPAELFLTVYWRSVGVVGPVESGRITAKAVIEHALFEALPALFASGGNNIGGFRLSGADHLVADFIAPSPSAVHLYITKTVRKLQFLASTGLRPITTMRKLHKLGFLDQMPGGEHGQLFEDITTGSWILLDQPYLARFESRLQDRLQWLSERGLLLSRPRWQALYNPPECIAALVASDADLLDRVSRVLGGLPDISIDLQHDSDTYFSTFTSPRHAPSTRPETPHKPVPRGAVPCGPADWRPRQSLSIEQHMKLGRILRGVRRFGLGSSTGGMLSAWTGRLDDWSCAEHRHATSAELDAMYYGKDFEEFTDLAAAQAGIQEAIAIVREGYNDCRPRRELETALQRAGKRLATLAAKLTA